MSTVEPWTPPVRRLHDELVEDGVAIPVDPWLAAVALDELDHARRPQVFERRTPLYGSLVFPAASTSGACSRVAELVELGSLELDVARRFADGRSSFLVRSPDRDLALACFERSVQYEADLVEIQAATGALIVQRTIMGTVRMFTDDGVVQWTGRSWTRRLGARAHLAALRPRLGRLPEALLAGLLDLSVHWLSPARIGTTFVVSPAAGPRSGFDLGGAVRMPGLSVRNRRHYAALFAALMQTDLAVTVTPDGDVDHLGVGLLASTRAEQHVPAHGGMRHTSARRYSYDHPEALCVVVSEDGPVTIFASGAAVAVCAAERLIDADAGVGGAEHVQVCPTCGVDLVVADLPDEPCPPAGDRCPVCGTPQDIGARLVRRVRTRWEA